MSMDQLMALVPIESSKALVGGTKSQGRKSRWERSPAARSGQKKSRWGRKDDKTYLPPPFIDVPPGLTPARLDQFLREQRLEELTFKIACGELEDCDPDIRPPSPPPVYDRNGNRTNTRDVRIRNTMNNEQQTLVEYCVKTVEGYAPPLDFRPQKKIKRIVIPQEKFPDYNFMGLIIGPRGCNHKRLELESGAQISIRGKGTQKEGKKTDQTDEEANMPQHVHIAADTADKVEKAVNLIEPLLDPFHPMHEDFKKRGLEQLALVNGVQMAKVEQRCAVCCAVGHLAWECPEMELQSFKRAQVKCNYCGDMGHVTMDCKLAKEAGVGESELRAKDQFAAVQHQQRAAAAPGGTGAPPPPPPPPMGAGAFGMPMGPQEVYDSAAMDREYKKMMAELTGEPMPDTAVALPHGAGTITGTGGIPGLTNGFATDEEDSLDSSGGHPPPPPGEPVPAPLGSNGTNNSGSGTHMISSSGMQQQMLRGSPNNGHRVGSMSGMMPQHAMMMAAHNPYNAGGGAVDYNAAAMQQYYNMYYGGHHGHGVMQQHSGQYMSPVGGAMMMSGGGLHHAAAAYAAGGVMPGHGVHPGMHSAAYAHAAHHAHAAAHHAHVAHLQGPVNSTAAASLYQQYHQPTMHHHQQPPHYAALQQHAATMMNGSTSNPYMSAYPGYSPYLTGAGTPLTQNSKLVYSTGNSTGAPAENGSGAVGNGFRSEAVVNDTINSGAGGGAAGGGTEGHSNHGTASDSVDTAETPVDGWGC
eukprot:Lankesteria_metandrocarpae@DN4276_c0_g1_i2.p1